MHKIAVIGTGYVGLVGGAGLADFGNQVVCVDRIKEKIDQLLRGEIPFYEPGLQEVVQRNVREGRLSFTTDFARAV
ncbi:MAG: UDP-glucose 6-dehydrogenase, partial [Candidatus Eisenbacteria sp.]|nr:UDP-glucose 6-dehydrogenase [Candidatus Eisenbacteria bacterium]